MNKKDKNKDLNKKTTRFQIKRTLKIKAFKSIQAKVANANKRPPV